jgi:hypothetical protein
MTIRQKSLVMNFLFLKRHPYAHLSFKNIPFSNKTKIYEEFNMRYCMEKLCKIDNISIF